MRLLPLFVTSLAIAATPQECLVRFAAMSGELTDALPLVRETYRDLWEELGAKVPRETLRSLVEGKDPFAEPAGADALAKRLREFRGMLEQKGWDTPDLRAQLLADLAARAGTLDTTAAKVETAVEREWTEHPVAFPSPSFATVLPNGTLLGVPVRPAQQGVYYLFDPKTRKVTTERAQELPLYGNAVVSPAGTEIFFGGENGALMRAPVVNGKPQLAQAKEVAKPHPTLQGTYLTDFFFTPTPNRLVTFDLGVYPNVVTFDVAKGEQTKIDIEGYLGQGKKVPARGMIPGSDDVWLMVQNTNGNELHRVSLQKDGTMKSAGPKRSWALPTYERATYLADGKSMLLSNERNVGYLVPGSTEPKSIFPGTGTKPLGDNAFIKDVVLHPKLNQAAVLIKDSGKYRVEWLDLDKQATVGQFTFFEKQDSSPRIEFSPDGNVMYAHDSDSTWHALNHRARLNP